MNRISEEAGSIRTPSPRGTKRAFRRAISLVTILIMVGTFLPSRTQALGIEDVLSLFGVRKERATSGKTGVQTMPLVEAATNIDPAAGTGGGDITIVDDSALLPEEGPSGTIADIEKPKNATISIYVVRKGDTLAGIAKLFGVSVNTIVWANGLSRGEALTTGETLTILPVTGIRYTVKKGDTVAGIARAFHADVRDVVDFNGVDGPLAVGTELIIPDGEAVSSPSTPSLPRSQRKDSETYTGGVVAQSGYYVSPLAHYRRTQGVHGYNAVDLAAPVGTPIVAAASGDVIVARGNGGWNGGYGKYVVIQHANGSQTLYAHASSVIVYAGERVVQGQVIGYVGSTGKSTGAHLHFEIRNGPRNPF